MYYSEEITPEIIRRLTKNEDTGDLYKIGTGNRIVVARKCSHCANPFYPNRKNQRYCSSSCRVMACYQRNRYRYKSGRYTKSSEHVQLKQDEKANGELIPMKDVVQDPFSLKRSGEAALGAAAVEAAKYFIHDKPMMDKIDRILSQVSGNTFSNGIRYVGIQSIGGRPVSVFKDTHNMTIVNDQTGKWFKLLTSNPPKWQEIKSP